MDALCFAPRRLGRFHGRILPCTTDVYDQNANNRDTNCVMFYNLKRFVEEKTEYLLKVAFFFLETGGVHKNRGRVKQPTARIMFLCHALGSTQHSFNRKDGGEVGESLRDRVCRYVE